MHAHICDKRSTIHYDGACSCSFCQHFLQPMLLNTLHIKLHTHTAVHYYLLRQLHKSSCLPIRQFIRPETVGHAWHTVYGTCNYSVILFSNGFNNLFHKNGKNRCMTSVRFGITFTAHPLASVLLSSFPSSLIVVLKTNYLLKYLKKNKQVPTATYF